MLGLESLSSFQYLCSFLRMYDLSYDLSYIYISFNLCQTNRRGSSEFVLHTGTPPRVIHVCFRVLAFHLCIRLCTVLFQVLVISPLCLFLPSIVFIFQVLGEKNP